MADIKKRTTRRKARKAKPRSPRAATTGQAQPKAMVEEVAQPAAAEPDAVVKATAQPKAAVKEVAQPAAAEPDTAVKATVPETTRAGTPSRPLQRPVDGPFLEQLMRDNPFRAKVISLLVKRLTS